MDRLRASKRKYVRPTDSAAGIRIKSISIVRVLHARGEETYYEGGGKLWRCLFMSSIGIISGPGIGIKGQKTGALGRIQIGKHEFLKRSILSEEKTDRQDHQRLKKVRRPTSPEVAAYCTTPRGSEGQVESKVNNWSIRNTEQPKALYHGASKGRTGQSFSLQGIASFACGVGDFNNGDRQNLRVLITMPM